MLKEAAAVTGGVLLLPPLGVSVVACGIPGLLIAGAGLFLADSVLNGMRPPAEPSDKNPEEEWTKQQAYSSGRE
jgi:hypothetical protein